MAEDTIIFFLQWQGESHIQGFRFQCSGFREEKQLILNPKSSTSIRFDTRHLTPDNFTLKNCIGRTIGDTGQALDAFTLVNTGHLFLLPLDRVGRALPEADAAF